MKTLKDLTLFSILCLFISSNQIIAGEWAQDNEIAYYKEIGAVAGLQEYCLSDVQIENLETVTMKMFSRLLKNYVDTPNIGRMMHELIGVFYESYDWSKKYQRLTPDGKLINCSEPLEKSIIKSMTTQYIAAIENIN